MLRAFFIFLAFTVVLVVAMAGFRGQKFKQPPLEIFPDMDRQPKVKAQDPSQFFADGRAARLPVEGSVPLGYGMPGHRPVEGQTGAPTTPYKHIEFGGLPTYTDTGMMGDQWGTGIPLPVNESLIARGQERFQIFCAICHDATGAGNGMAKQFGMSTVVSLHQERLRTMPDGEIFNTITHGKNTMFAYGDRIPVPDRWAIVAYLRALQLSQGGATLADVPADERAKLEAAP